MQNGFIERFNGSFRRGVLDMLVFRNLGEVCEQAERWLADYNTEIPQDSLGGLTPAEFRQYHEPATSNLAWHQIIGGRHLEPARLHTFSRVKSTTYRRRTRRKYRPIVLFHEAGIGSL